MTLRLSALLVWILAGAAAVFWGMRLLVPATPLPTGTQVAAAGPSLRGDLTRLLGAAPVAAPTAVAVAPDAASRFRLTGVVATRTAREPSGPPAPGLALISVDGSPPQAYRVGDALDAQFTLAAVGLRSARVSAGAGDAGFLLELPPPTPPATGVPGFMGSGGAPPNEMPFQGGRPVPGQTPSAPYMVPGQGMPPPGMPQPGMPPPGMPQPGMAPQNGQPPGSGELDGRGRLETQ